MSKNGELNRRLREFEKELIVQCYKDESSNQSETARVLGISRTALIYKLKEYGLLDKRT